MMVVVFNFPAAALGIGVRVFGGRAEGPFDGGEPGSRALLAHYKSSNMCREKGEICNPFR